MKKEMTMEVRLLLAFVLMGLVIFGTQYFYKPPPQPAPAATKTAQPALSAPAATPAEPAKPASEPVTAEMPGQIHADQESTVTVDTDFYTVVFSNRGAVVTSWVLKGQKDQDDKPLDLVNQKALGRVPAPFAVAFKSQAPQTDPNGALFQVERSDGDLNLTFEFSDGRADTKKTFVFAKSSYLVRVSSQVTANGVLLPHLLQWRGGFGDETVSKPATYQHALHYDVTAAKLVSNDSSAAKNGPVSTSGQFSFAGLEDQFFAAVFLPGSRPSIEITTYSDNVAVASGSDEQRVGAAVGGDGLNTFSLFVGTKDTDLLRRVDPKLEQLIDWGWFGIIARPLFTVLRWTAANLARHNYGWAIVLVTVAINLVLFPLRLTSMKSSKKMQVIQPQIAAINAKYKGLSIKDPKKTEQNQEVMELYKKHGINPLGGCVPMLLQIPFLYAFYKVLSVTVEMRGAHWLWVTDLTRPETLAIHMLPVILVVTQFVTQKMTPAAGVDPSQQKMMMFMPLLFGYMFYGQAAGLVLYWLTSNFVGIAQQWLLNRGAPPPQVIDVKPVPKKKR